MNVWNIEKIAPLPEMVLSAGRYLLPDLKESPHIEEDLVPVWSYLYNADRRLLIQSIGQSLDAWTGLAIVRFEVIAHHQGEFEGTVYLKGRRGFRMTLFPPDMCVQYHATEVFHNAIEAIRSIDFEVLNPRPVLQSLRPAPYGARRW